MKRFIWRFAVYWTPLLVWMGVIFWWSSLSGAEIESLEPASGAKPFSFNAVHFVEFAALAAAACWAFRSVGRLSMPALWGAALALVALYAGSDELHQSFTPGRSASFADFAVDLLGGVTGLAVADTVLERVRPRRGGRRGGDGVGERDKSPG